MRTKAIPPVPEECFGCAAFPVTRCPESDGRRFASAEGGPSQSSADASHGARRKSWKLGAARAAGKAQPS